MTYEEAIEQLQVEYLGEWEADRLAKNMGIEALKKQVPMKPNVYEEEYTSDYKCPKCGCRLVSKIDSEFVFVAGMLYPYCYICGQHIDWREVE